MIPLVDVSIASYKRPDQLRRLLLSLVRQETDGRISIAIHVADNDAERSAEPVVRELRESGFDISYDVEPVQNISLARNRSMAQAHGDWIATIDDDLHADPRWLINMVDAAARHGADVVHGWNVSRFPAGTPDYIRRFHERPYPPSGSTDGYILSTGESLFRRSLIDGMPAPFDPRFGRIGGEDTDFFERLRKSGCRMVFCREAKVYCDVPAERSTLRWIMQRRMRHGSNLLLLRGEPLTAWFCLRSMLTIGLRLLYTALCLLCTLYVFCGRVPRRALRRAMLSFVGALLTGAYLFGRVRRHLGFVYEEYKAR